MTIKSWITILIFSTIFSCAAQKNVPTKSPKIITATSQKFSGGVKGSPQGVKYKIQFVAPGNQEEFMVKGFWVDESYMEAIAYLDKIGVSKIKFEKGDTVTVASSFYGNDGKLFEVSDTESLSRPKNMASKGLINASLKGKTLYIEVSDFKQLPPELRP